MSALKLTITSAGYAALRNAEANGTNAVVIAQAGMTPTAFTPDASMTSVPGELKRVSTISGGATAADTMHVTIRDGSTDTYSLFGIGLYLNDGTLFAVYSQPTLIGQKSAQAALLIAMDTKFADINAASLTFGDTNFQLNMATTDTPGVVRLALNADVIAGTDAVKVVTSAGVRAAMDDRLGAGAPTSFVKGLLSAATALAFRAALAIKGAALYDPGANNGLDADLLDGQQGVYYRDFSNLQNVPATATRWPAVAEVTGLQGALDAKQASLGFTPVQQGTGVGQNANTVKIGWANAAGKLKATVDATDQGNFAFESWVVSFFAPINVPTFTGGAMGLTMGDPKKQLTIATSDFVSFNCANGYNTGNFQWMFAGVTGMTLSKDNKLAVGGAHTPVGAIDAYTGGGRILLRVDGANHNTLDSVTYDNVAYAPLNISSNGSLTHNGNTVWDAANFDPNSKLNINPGYLGSDANAVAVAKVGIGALTQPSTNTPDGGWTDIVNVCDANWGFQIAHPWFGTDVYTRCRQSGAFSAWRKFVTSDMAGSVSIAELIASGAITGGSIRSTGTIMAAGGFQIG